ncbi:MAG: hypothetical protein C0506_03230 [Anaerolinea sp.]|nr:hypothetical protein [Anaerolinea sp.]
MLRHSARAAFTVFALGIALAAAACEKPDASFTTSPSVRALIGTTTGNVAFNAPEIPPAVKAPPSNWKWELALARFTKLENEAPALMIVLQMQSRPGAGMELWLTEGGRTVARWSAGSTAVYSGTVCFQLLLESAAEAVPLGTGTHELTVAFREPSSGVVTAKRANVTSRPPELSGAVPAPGSEVFREALSCPRGS